MTKLEMWNIIVAENVITDCMSSDCSIHPCKTCDCCKKTNIDCLEIIADAGDGYENPGQSFWVCKECFLKGE